MKKYDMKEFKPNEKLKLVKTEKEFWDTHKYYLGKMKMLRYDLKKFIYNPDLYLKEFEQILTDMVTTGVMSIEQSNEIRQDLYNKLNDPKPFKKWSNKLKKRYDSIKNKN